MPSSSSSLSYPSKHHQTSYHNNPVRQLLDHTPDAIDGFLSYEYGLCPPHPLQELQQEPYRLWETWAKSLPFLYKSGRYREFFDQQPVLEIQDLPDEDLLRANQILGLCAHAVVHFSEEEEEELVTDEDAGEGNDTDESSSTGTPASIHNKNHHNTIRGGWITERFGPTRNENGSTTTTSSHQNGDAPPSQCPFKPSMPSSSMKKNQNSGARCPFKPSMPNNKDDNKPTNSRKSERRIPASIREPWKAVNVRLGRPLPTFTYYDYFTLNVVHKNHDSSESSSSSRTTPFDLTLSSRSQYDALRCDVSVFGDQTENVFVIMNYDLEVQSIPLVRLACDATDCIVQHDTAGLAKVLYDMGNVVNTVTEAFLHASPNVHSELFCDPVSWSKSIGILIPPILDGEMSMSGLQSSFTHLVDALIGRYEYTGDLGDLANEERPWLPSLHQEFFRRLNQVSIRKYVLNSTDGTLHGSFNRLVRLFVYGFLEAHRIKMMGFLELGIKTGRSQSSGQTAQAATGWQGRVWRKVNDDCLHSMKEREQLLTRPNAKGFTGALVESITRVTPKSESYKVVFNTVGSGVRYEAGDRVEVLPRNPPTIVSRMLAALQTTGGGLGIPVATPEWRSAVEQHYPEMGHHPVLPLASLLKIMVLRPLSRSLVAQVCQGLKIKDEFVALEAFRAGRLDDVPDLIELLRQSCGLSLSDKVVSNICYFLSPLSPRLYSIANAPSYDDCPLKSICSESKVSIIISRLWYRAASVTEEETDEGAEDRLGVATSCLLNDSLYNFVPIRVVEERGFRLPDPSFSGSILLLALGSGASPMFAFLEELLKRKAMAPTAKHPEVFFCWGLARPENLFGVPLLEKAIQEIGLNLCVSFSRDHKTVRVREGKIKIGEGRRERVTTTMLKDCWPETISRLAKGTGMFYICGHPSLGNTVRSVIEHALAMSGMMSLSESRQQYARVVAGNRVRSDMFYSGSIHDAKLPSFSPAEVARHNRTDDIWMIYKDFVYDLTEYMNLHPGGNKILFDKAGRDGTDDFLAAHGPNNLRIESAMMPYRIGHLSLPRCNTPAEREAYGLVLTFLHTVCEIRNVFYLDVNSFEDANEAAGSAHSLAMRAKTHNKFISSSVPMLYNAMTRFQKEAESFQHTSCKRCPRLCASNLDTLKTFSDGLQAMLLSIPDCKTLLASELCTIEKKFLSEFVFAVTSLAEKADAFMSDDNGQMLTIPDLHDMCERTIQQLDHIFHSNDVPPLDSGEMRDIRKSLSSLSAGDSLANVDLDSGQRITCRQLSKGDYIFSAGDILDLIYIVLEGAVVARDDLGTETDFFCTGSAFGATRRAHQIAPQNQLLGNQSMAYSAVVDSESCRVAVIHPMQMLMARTTDTESTVNLEDILFDGNSSISSFGSKSAISANQALLKKAVLRVTVAQAVHETIKTLAIRKSNLMQYFPSEACDALAVQSSEMSIAAGHELASAGSSATKFWILIEGRIGVEMDDQIVWEYNKAGQVFGERGFALAVRKTEDVFFKETMVALKDSRVLEIPREAIDSICNGPLKKEARALKKLDCLVSKHPVLNRLPKLSRFGFLRIFRQVRIPANEVLFERGEAGNSAFVVIAGKLQLHSADGDIDELNPGDGTGFDMLLQPGERDVTCVAAVGTICWTTNHEALREGLRVSARHTVRQDPPGKIKDKAKKNNRAGKDIKAKQRRRPSR